MKTDFCVYKKQYVKNKYKKKSPQKRLSRLATHKKAPLSRSLLGSTYSVTLGDNQALPFRVWSKHLLRKRQCSAFCYAKLASPALVRRVHCRPVIFGVLCCLFRTWSKHLLRKRLRRPVFLGVLNKDSYKKEDSFRSPQIYLFS